MCLIQENWRNLKIAEIEAMISKPVLVADPVAGSAEFRTNFDPVFFTFLKENERLAKMDIIIPSVNQFLIKKRDYFTAYSDAIAMILHRYLPAIVLRSFTVE